MRGDFSSATFDPRLHVTAVVVQQGRVSTDADFNEQTAILLAMQRATVRDVIGGDGGPRLLPGFAVSVDGDLLLIGPGRFYVDGIACTNHDAFAVERRGGPLAVYLDVWERHVTWLEDDAVGEAALAAPDTSTRQQTVWRIVTVPRGTECCAPRPTLGVRGAYAGIENQLYRVEIHSGGPSGTAMFKWSRDNASVLALVRAFGPELLATSEDRSTSEPRPVMPGDWIELEDGVEVSFPPHDGTYAAGDYWLFNPRLATDGDDTVPPTGVIHHYALLADIDDDGTVTDCRRLFGADPG